MVILNIKVKYMHIGVCNYTYIPHRIYHICGSEECVRLIRKLCEENQRELCNHTFI